MNVYMRVSKRQRDANARKFYALLGDGNHNKAAILVHRVQNSNKCQFITGFLGLEAVLAESSLGYTECFMEFLSAIKAVKPCETKTMHDEEFLAWLFSNYRLRISYNDGLIMMLERV